MFFLQMATTMILALAALATFSRFQELANWHYFLILPPITMVVQVFFDRIKKNKSD